ncbi:LytTR family DNA-binding domain-containing protein [Ekhidna sp.]|uniref:LytTR family DNA-binding domain-containing protein n=1 Tax=Ekhidna sp. TaxID=2608089 RepID=UPI0032EB255A
MSSHKYFHWLYYVKGYATLYNFITAIFFWAFLIITRPFGIYYETVEGMLRLALYFIPFGLFFPLSSFSVDFLSKWIWPSGIANFKVNGFFWLLKMILFIHLIYVLRQLWCDWQCFDSNEYLELWIACFLLVGFTYIPFMIYGKFLYYHSLVGKDPDSINFTLIQGSGNESLQVDLQHLVLLKADDNYVDFLVKSGDKLTSKTLRTTLKSMKDQLSDHPQFQRIHRSYIVNIQFVVSRNSSSLIIKSGNWTEELTISPTYKEAIDALLN